MANGNKLFQVTYRIHPGIGIARIGDSPTEWFPGPEVPDYGFVPPGGKYRDAQGRIKRQAASFRIYEHRRPFGGTGAELRLIGDTEVREITQAEADITWHVHLANAKSFERNPPEKIVNNPGEKTIRGANASVEATGHIFGEDVTLGTLRTDDDGRLLMLGGFGRSRSPRGAPLEGLFCAGWYDDVSDGPVRATIRLHGSDAEQAVEPAWAIVGVPGFAHPVTSIVTLYDLAYHVATMLPPPDTLAPPDEVSFARDIYPLLRRAALMPWVSQAARFGHGGSAGGAFLRPDLFPLLHDPTGAAAPRRTRVFNKLKNPAGGPGGNMPQLNGLTVTPFQYERMRRWSVGDFVDDWDDAWEDGPPVTPLSDLSPAEQTEALDQAGLVTGIGGSFAPGIEAGEVMANAQTYERPFRIRRDQPPGALTASLSIPWQADFTACGTGWWPSARPNSVTANGTTFDEWVPPAWGMEDMVASWQELGFIARRDGENVYVETERLVT